MRAEDYWGYTCSYPRCNACLRKDGAPDCAGSGCAEPRCRTCEGTETDREEEKQYHNAREYLVSLPTAGFKFPNPSIPDHGKVNGGQPSTSRPAIPQAWVDNYMPWDFDERYKCKTCKNWEKYWKRASTLTDEERRQQDDTKLHYFFGKSGTYCTCAPEDMAQRVVKEYHLDWEPKDKDGKAINFRTFGPDHMPTEVLVDRLRTLKRITKSIQADESRRKRRKREQDLIFDSWMRVLQSQNAMTNGHKNVRGVDNNQSSMPGSTFIHSAQTGLTTELPSTRPSDSAATTAPSNTANLVAGPSSGTSELPRKRRHAETIETEGNDSVLSSVEDQSQSMGLDDSEFDLLISGFLARNDLDPSCDRREALLKRVVALLRGWLIEVREIDAERLENLTDEVNEIFQGCTCEARMLWFGDRL